MIELYNEYNPKVSVIIPTYNRLKLLKRAIDSVLNQTFVLFEVLVVDDGSTDSTFNMIREYEENHTNIRYMRHSNRRLPLSLNAGILASAGEYVTFLGSDDEYKPEHLEIRVKILENNIDIDMLYGGVEIIGDPFVKDKNDLSKRIHLSDCVIGGTFFGKKNVFIAMEGFKNISYSEDSEFFERAAKKFNFVKIKDETYIYYRDTTDSICNNI